VKSLSDFPYGRGKLQLKPKTMADSLSIQPAALSNLTGIFSVASQRSLTSAPVLTAPPALFSQPSNIVALSQSGQLLSGAASFLDVLQAQPTAPPATDNSTGQIVSTARDLVDAFNRLPTSTISSTNGSTTEVSVSAGNPLVAQLAEALNAPNPATNDATTILGSLQSIGITLQTTPTSTTLQLDQDLLSSVASANPAATQAVLTGAAQSLIAPTREFVATLADNAALPADLTQLGVSSPPAADLNVIFGRPSASTDQDTTLPFDILQNLNTDTIANIPSLNELNLAAAGVAANSVPAAASSVRETLVARPPTSTTATDGQRLANDTTTPTQVSTAATLPPTTKPVATDQDTTIIGSTPTISQTVGATTESTAGLDRQIAELRASENRLTLENLLADPSLQNFRNHFDPAYSALIAAAHLSDFISPDTFINPKALSTDAVAPTSPIANSHAIAYYNEAAGEESRQLTNRTTVFSNRQLTNSPRFEISA
jgi:hypothetical protein